MTDIVERLHELSRSRDSRIMREAADEIVRLRAELEQLKVSLVRICGMAHNDQRVMEVRPRDDVMPGAFIAKLKRPR